MNNLIASGKRYRVILADCLEAMAGMEENSIDAVVCDPPYGLFFMGKSWDSGTPPTPFWKEALRVAKPGAYLLAFGGTRTFHRLACAIEDAGWILRDTMMWVYGSGFPKSHDVSKALDRKAGAEREVVGMREGETARRPPKQIKHCNQFTAVNPSKRGYNTSEFISKIGQVTTPATPEAKQWEGFGTALKPAYEMIILAQAPLDGTYAENVLKWGCGALNIDGCRIGGGGNLQRKNDSVNMFGVHNKGTMGTPDGQGRWPANFLLSHSVFCEKVGEKRVSGIAPMGKPSVGRKCKNPIRFKDNYGGQSYADSDGLETVEDWRCVPDCPVAILDGQSGVLKSGRLLTHHRRSGKRDSGIYHPIRDRTGEPCNFGGDQGGASRFFYCAKASREERNAGLEAVHTLFERREAAEDKIQHRMRPDKGQATGLNTDPRWAPKLSKNNHPTVKPIALLRYLCRLVTPPGGTVLDPFVGSGSTGCAAVLEGFNFVGIEKEKGYAEIARARIAHFSPHP